MLKYLNFYSVMPLKPISANGLSVISATSLSGIKSIFNYCKTFWLMVLALSILVCMLHSVFGWRLEDMQTIVFPVSFLALCKLPVSAKFRLPAPVLFIVLLTWASSALYVRGYFGTISGKSQVYLARLDQDQTGMFAQGLANRFNEIAKLYRLPKMNLIQTHFSSVSDGLSWVGLGKERLLLLIGDQSWLKVLFHPNGQTYLGEVASFSAIDSQFMDEAQKLDLKVSQEVFMIQDQRVGLSLAAVIVPEQVSVPVEPIELSQHFLNWLARGLAGLAPVASANSDPQTVRKAGLNRDAFLQASEILGNWRSNGPLGLAHFFIANSDLLLARKTNFQEEALLQCALYHYRKAVARAAKRSDPTIYAAVFNNAAVVRVLMAKDSNDLKNAKKWLITASNVEDGLGNPVRGAKLALLNLISLQRSGF